MKFFRVIFYLCVSLSSFSLKAEEPKEGWIVFATPNYFSLLEVTIASIHEFSTRHVVAVGLNEDIPFSTEKYPRLIKKRIDVDLNMRKAYYYKPQAMLAANLERGVYVDADTVINKGCDDLFLYCDYVDEYPLCPIHQNDAWVWEGAMEFFGTPTRSMHYVHNDVIVYSDQCRKFMLEWQEMCMEHFAYGIPVWDETLINVHLWKVGATKCLPRCDPYNADFDEYMRADAVEIEKPPYHQWYVFHGNKEPHIGWNMLQQLIRRHKGS